MRRGTRNGTHQITPQYRDRHDRAIPPVGQIGAVPLVANLDQTRHGQYRVPAACQAYPIWLGE